MTTLEKAKNLLASGKYTCVLCNDSEVHTSTKRGVRPLMEWITSGTDFQHFYAADKVVGKATAFLYVHMGIVGVFANVISEGALQILQEYGICTTYHTLVKNIINRKGDGICPFEAAVMHTNEVEEAFTIICRTMETLQ